MNKGAGDGSEQGQGLRSYVTVTLAYWALMLTDGALRMLVLLHFHGLGYTPLTLALLFVFYEFFGVLTNLYGGWLAMRSGLKTTLMLGLGMQVVALGALSFLDPQWDAYIAFLFVMLIQALSGIAKDLTKMSSKTAVKSLVPAGQKSMLFKVVGLLTGSKNAIKGAGFFIGGALLEVSGFQHALWWMTGLLMVVWVGSQVFLPAHIGTMKKTFSLVAMFQQSRSLHLLAGARFFLFGARDLWFVVALPLFLFTELQWNYTEIGSFMALWIIVYGFIQATCPALLIRVCKGCPPDGLLASVLSGTLLCTLLGLLGCLYAGCDSQATLIIGLYVFALIFAMNSAVHSFLILDYADSERVAAHVGYYYMANAAGRLVGTLGSGIMYQVGGLSVCLLASMLCVLAATCISWRLPRRSAQA